MDAAHTHVWRARESSSSMCLSLPTEERSREPPEERPGQPRLLLPPPRRGVVCVAAFYYARVDSYDFGIEQRLRMVAIHRNSYCNSDRERARMKEPGYSSKRRCETSHLKEPWTSPTASAQYILLSCVVVMQTREDLRYRSLVLTHSLELREPSRFCTYLCCT